MRRLIAWFVGSQGGFRSLGWLGVCGMVAVLITMNSALADTGSGSISGTITIHLGLADTGSGGISGTFTDTVPTQPQTTFQVGWSDDFPLGAYAAGQNTAHYTWGLWQTGSYPFLDGVEMTPEQYDAATDEQWTAWMDADRLAEQWGPSGNGLEFTGHNFVNQEKGQTFVAGILEYSNGVAQIGTDVPSVLLKMESSSNDPGFTQFLEAKIDIVTTPNVYDDQGNMLDEPSADFIYFADRPELGSFRVYEGHSTYVEVLAEFNSLDLIGFGSVGDPSAGFLSDSVDVPEPSTFVLLGAFAVSLSAYAWRRQRRAA